MLRLLPSAFSLPLCLALALGCATTVNPTETIAPVDRPDGWSELTHGDHDEPDYERVFPHTSVQRLDVRIDATTYAAMQADLDSVVGGSGGPPGGPGSDTSEDPSFFPVTVEYEGIVWTHVGMRYKGNSSLQSAYRNGSLKLPFRLDFDEFEDDYPEIDDQRFYGFKKLTFSSAFSDPSLIREKLCGELFADAGIPTARSAFYRVYLDVGDGAGPVYAGLYTMVEDLSDQFLRENFVDASGNLYKPDGVGASWGSFDVESFPKKSNEDEADYGDIQAAIAALHADRTDAAAWRAELESRFNVGEYLHLLAVNQAIQNWDTYGLMTHNYYLYGDPSEGGRLLWMPWDLNECMLERRSTSVALDEVTDAWPVIRYLLDDPVYRAAYFQELDVFLAGAFEEGRVEARMQELHDLVAPFVAGAEGEQAPYTNLSNQAAFEGSLTSGADALLPHVAERHALVRAAVDAE